MTGRTARSVRTTGRGGSKVTLIWALVAAVLGLSVYLANGAPLFYFDTASYLNQGAQILDVAGIHRVTVPVVAEQVAAPGSVTVAKSDHLVDGSRSAVYGIVLAVLNRVWSLDLAVILNFGAIGLSVFLTARYMAGPVPPGPSALRLTAMALSAGCLGSLAFYIAFLMPDILTPVLILSVALMFSHGARMGVRDHVMVLVLALFAVLSHPSHLLIAAALVPAALLVSPVLRGRRMRVVLGLLGLLVVLGATERLVFRVAVERLEHKGVFYLPFLTARLISDGPGAEFLERHCPEPGLETCALWSALQLSDDPVRLEAPVILFAEDPAFGSYRLLADDVRQKVSDEQFDFLLTVVREDPWGVLGPLVRNVGVQLIYNHVEMTIPPEGQAAKLGATYGSPVTELREGRLVRADRFWLGPLGLAQDLLYGLSLVVIAGLILTPGRIPPENRALAILVILGILANALVCGGVSEPASRYGARVASLLPMLAVLLWFGARPEGLFGRAGRV